MSDHSIVIVAKKSAYPNNETKAKEILSWLVSRDIVKPMLSDCVLDSEMGYEISNGAKEIVSLPECLPFGLKTNGLSIITKRTVFDTGENGLEEVICPKCKKNIIDFFWNQIDPWFDEKSDYLICPHCESEADINKYQFKPEWGFSNLGFEFWNWPEMKDVFISEFKNKLGCETSLIFQHL